MYAEIAIGLAARKTFTYKVPARLREKARLGQRAIVPLSGRLKTGFIVGFSSGDGQFDYKDIIDIPDMSPLVPEGLLKLLKWLSEYYIVPLGLVLAAAIAPGVEEGKPARPRKEVREKMAASGLDEPHFHLTQPQKDALGTINAVDSGTFVPFLLHGATGSGKTEVYLRAIKPVVEAGMGAVVLVPEISLTPQLVRRFSHRFGEKVAVLHSGLTPSQRRQEWHRIRQGEALVAVGARSAVFAPFERLGMVVVDEEHDASYKQEEGVRYNARDAAVMRAKLSGCPVILGSATPSLESYHNAVSGKYTLLNLPGRTAGRPMPKVTLVDLKEPVQDGSVNRQTVDQAHRGQLTEPLINAAKTRLENGEQALFFLNRRGHSDFIICRDCGEVPKCGACSVSMTYHRQAREMRCHWCGAAYPAPTVCPKCGGDRIKYVGGGTEKLQRELERLFPDFKTSRIDKDSVAAGGGFVKLLDDVASGETKIVVGTQMVSKGHDMPGIGIVGVVLADYGLNQPDFRAAERTFQVVTQVAGRSGRGEVPGEVVVQTYRPEHYSLQCASRHDYKSFYDEEIVFRKELGLPPFSRLALVIVKGVKPEKAQDGAAAATGIFKKEARGKGVEVMGPAPAPVKRVRGKYRHFIMLRSKSHKKLHEVLEAGLKLIELNKAAPACKVEVDVDPQGMM
jgi:primosomal protein N' (replication factor Y) (superfamily II helicase)